MKRVFYFSVIAVALASCLFTGCSTSNMPSSSGSASSVSSNISTSVSSSSTTTSESSSISSSTSSSSVSSNSSKPEPSNSSYSKVNVLDCSLEKNTYTTTTVTTEMINGCYQTITSKITHYGIIANISLKNTGTLSRSVDESNFFVLWDNSSLKIGELLCNDSSPTFLKAGESATYTLRIPITKAQYDDWSSQHIVTLTILFKEEDSANDTYTVYQYLTSTGAVSLKK